MSTQEEAMARRTAALLEAGIHIGGGGKFTSDLHPHDRSGKFMHTFTLKKHSVLKGSNGKVNRVDAVHVNGQHVGYASTHTYYSHVSTGHKGGGAQLVKSKSVHYRHGTSEKDADLAMSGIGDQLGPKHSSMNQADLTRAVQKHVEAKYGDKLPTPTPSVPKPGGGAPASPPTPADVTATKDEAKNEGALLGGNTPGEDFSKHTDAQLNSKLTSYGNLLDVQKSPSVRATLHAKIAAVEAEREKRKAAAGSPKPTGAEVVTSALQQYAASQAAGDEKIPGAGAVVNGVAGRHVKLNGVQVHIPHHAAFERTQGGDKFTSPAGSTAVYRNGVAYSMPRGAVPSAAPAPGTKPITFSPRTKAAGHAVPEGVSMDALTKGGKVVRPASGPAPRMGPTLKHPPAHSVAGSWDSAYDTPANRASMGTDQAHSILAKGGGNQEQTAAALRAIHQNDPATGLHPNAPLSPEAAGMLARFDAKKGAIPTASAGPRMGPTLKDQAANQADATAITRTKLPNGSYAFHDQNGKQLRTSKHAYTHMSTYENGATTFHKTPESASKPSAEKWYGVPRTKLVAIKDGSPETASEGPHMGPTLKPPPAHSVASSWDNAYNTPANRAKPKVTPQIPSDHPLTKALHGELGKAAAGPAMGSTFKPTTSSLAPNHASSGARSPTGALRNFTAMSHEKLQAAHAQVRGYNATKPQGERDTVGQHAIEAEMNKRGLSAAAPKPALPGPSMGPTMKATNENLRPELNSPGRSSAGRLRNFQAMSDAKLTTVLTQLTQHNHPTYGQDHEGLAAAQAEAIKRTMHQHMQEADFSDADREKLAKKGAAMPDGSFPIRNGADLSNAIHAVGRAKNPAAVKRHIIKRAKALKAESALPDDWTQEAAVEDADETALVATLAGYAIAEGLFRGPAPRAFDVLAAIEAADSLAKANTPQPFSTSKTSNWVARLGGLPDYIQHVAHGLVKSGKTESEAIGMAVGIMTRWARGGGGVDKNTQAAASLALGQWDKLKAKQAGLRAAKAAS